ncbi:hypothetical protein SDRG_11238 [Saprolegnia diclina VS20]|uniref:Uncharacterized protein n=1 Tax=Saprolegnia diclina (strain VS20) TaxID=1156394 RepID=T0RM68_SAPDV|nr:hypothetical protein SDRG_11238 [Saprolegnia diclina VS20]EQC31052.1 hypothetical protein SDRG_11238 [Saprolegnia diclina VS20]|eukprot:XP_008615491.1 hypothetical protein SDRG_11238 [Saprolegnia diclina VS20]
MVLPTSVADAVARLSAALSSTLLELQTHVRDLTATLYAAEAPLDPTTLEEKSTELEARADEAAQSLTSQLESFFSTWSATWTELTSPVAERYGATARDVLEKIEGTKVMLEQTLGEGKLQLQLHYNAAMRSRPASTTMVH